MRGGQGTNSVTLDLGVAFTSGSLKVSAGIICGTSNERIAVLRSVPAKPGAITGSTGVCSIQTGVAHRITAVNGSTTYNWIVPAGATIASGQNSTAIVVNYGINGGNVKVIAGNGCGNSAYRSLANAVVCKEAVDALNVMDISVYPNPAETDFTIQLQQLSNDSELILRDITGRIVEMRKLSVLESSVNLCSNWPGGFYIVELWDKACRKGLKLQKL